MSVIDHIKQTLSIADVLERYAGVNFLKASTNRKQFNICCPYHSDRSPSFTVYTVTNTFHCWSGCNDGKSGDVIDIVKLSLNIGTKEAIKTLISDFGLAQPDTEQVKKWQKKRADRQRTADQNKLLNEKIIDSSDVLRKVEKASRDVISSIKTIEDLERVGDLYHISTQVNYWMDCLLEDDQIIQQTLEEVSHFLNDIRKKAV